jgi:hypothetical protein
MASLRNKGEEAEDVSLAESAQQLLDECRMVLPGMQALFGFQLIVVFNNGFESLAQHDKVVHLVATGLVAMAVALIMTPAAFHRQTTPRRVSARFIALSSKLLLLSMVPLAIGICLDFYLVARRIAGETVGIALAVPLLALFAALWFGLPRLRRMRERAGRAS